MAFYMNFLNINKGYFQKTSKNKWESSKLKNNIAGKFFIAWHSVRRRLWMVMMK